MTGKLHRWSAAGSGVDQSWRDRAGCRGMDPELFTLTGRELTADNQTAYAVCRSSCPVSAECFESAIKMGDVSTIRGLPITGTVEWQWAECEMCGGRFARPPRSRRGKSNQRVGARRFCSRECAWRNRRRVETETVGRVSELASATRGVAA